MLNLSRDQVSKLNDICSKHMVKHLYLFGSAVSDHFDSEKSDIDLLVEFSKDLEILNYADNYFSLLKSLENFFSRKVDLLSYKALKNPVIIEEVEKSKVALYAA